MKTASPVDGNFALLAIQSRRALHTATCADPTELEQPVEHWTIISDIVLALLFTVRLHIVRRYSLQEVDVVVGVELCHFVLGGWFRSL